MSNFLSEYADVFFKARDGFKTKLDDYNFYVIYSVFEDKFSNEFIQDCFSLKTNKENYINDLVYHLNHVDYRINIIKNICLYSLWNEEEFDSDDEYDEWDLFFREEFDNVAKKLLNYINVSYRMFFGETFY